VNLLQILEKVIGSLPGIILGVETVMHGLSGTAKKDEALKGVGEVLDGIVATGTQIAKDTFLTVASDMIDVYVAGAHAIGAWTHHDQEGAR